MNYKETIGAVNTALLAELDRLSAIQVGADKGIQKRRMGSLQIVTVESNHFPFLSVYDP